MSALCTACNKDLDQILVDAGMKLHPGCDKTPDVPLAFQPSPSSRKDGLTDELAIRIKDEFVSVITWSEHSTPRSQQRSIGPSQLGTPCERQFAWLMAGLPAVNAGGGDPWPAFVGSAIHTRVEAAYKRWMAANGPRWVQETRVQATPMIGGRFDMYSEELSTLIDVKSAGPDMFSRVVKSGPTPGYIVQAMVYGYALRQMGKPVDHVGWIFVPRSGWLKTTHVVTMPYDDAIATDALSRPDRSGQKLMELDIFNNPHRWQQIEAAPSYLCEWCPMFNWRISQEDGASDRGCPGDRGLKKAKEK